jgi:branched-chain amino acid transport system permease protein
LRLYHGFHIPFEIDLLAGGIAASIFGVIFGLPALRMRGLYFALITLMIAGAFQVFISAIGFPDGGPGFTGKIYSGARQYMPHPPIAQSDAAYFTYVVVVVAIGFIIVMLVQRSRAGRAWALIRRSEPVAVAMGVNIVAYKVVAFALAGFLAGVAGGLMSANIGQLDGRAFPPSDSIMMFALTVIGGAFHWSGPIFAGLLLRAVPGLLNDWHVDGNVALMVFGAGLLHALITAPQGVSGQVVSLSRLLAAKLSAAMPRMMERKL